MKEKEMTKDEIKKYLIWFLTEAKDWSLKEYRLYEKCYKENPDITEDLIRDNEISWENKKYQWEDMTNSLFRCGRCADIAVEIAEKVVNRMLFPPKEHRADELELNWNDADEKQLRQWLLCRCDELPDTIPLHCYMDDAVCRRTGRGAIRSNVLCDRFYDETLCLCTFQGH